MERRLLMLAGATILAWWLALNLARSHTILDERLHTRVIGHLLTGSPIPPDLLAMPATYHHFAAAVLRPLAPPPDPADPSDWAVAALPRSLWILRGLNAACGLLALAAFWWACRPVWREQAGWRTLLIAWNPLIFPFMAVCYTDIPALLPLAAGLALHVHGRWSWAAICLLLSALLRQSHAFWLLWFAGLAVLDVWKPASNGSLDPAASSPGRSALTRVAHVARAAQVARAVGPYLAVLVLYALLLASFPAELAPAAAINRPKFNPAQFYLFALLLALLHLPHWLPALLAHWRTEITPRLLRAGVLAGVVGLVAALTLLYRSTHPYNFGLGTYRNYILHVFQEQPGARLVLALLLVAAAVGGWLAHRATPAGFPGPARLAWVWGGALLFLAPHWLVEPRYYLAPLLLIDFHTHYTGPQLRRLVGWYAAATAAILVPTLLTRDPAGGLW